MCESLLALPDVSMLRALRMLDMMSCDSLAALPESVSGLVSLETLNLGSCPRLETLPEGIGGMTSLFTL